MKVLVSACLLGENCKYNGGNNYCARVAERRTADDLWYGCTDSLCGFNHVGISEED